MRLSENLGKGPAILDGLGGRRPPIGRKRDYPLVLFAPLLLYSSGRPI